MRVCKPVIAIITLVITAVCTGCTRSSLENTFTGDGITFDYPSDWTVTKDGGLWVIDTQSDAIVTMSVMDGVFTKLDEFEYDMKENYGDVDVERFKSDDDQFSLIKATDQEGNRVVWLYGFDNDNSMQILCQLNSNDTNTEKTLEEVFQTVAIS